MSMLLPRALGFLPSALSLLFCKRPAGHGCTPKGVSRPYSSFGACELGTITPYGMQCACSNDVANPLFSLSAYGTSTPSLISFEFICNCVAFPVLAFACFSKCEFLSFCL